jgi:hypothetical protein
MTPESEPTVKLLSYADDMPRNGQGMLIPRQKEAQPKHTFTPLSARTTGPRSFSYGRGAAVLTAALALFLLGTTSYGVVTNGGLAAAPIVTVIDPGTQSSVALEYGPQAVLAERSLFIETRDSFIEERLTFIEVDLTEQQLRYFKNGVLYQSADILSVGAPGSWWDTPSGLYKIEGKSEREFTNIGQAYLPYQLTFEHNFVIHGWPTYPDKTPVAADFAGGGIRLSDEAAQKLFEEVSPNIPVLVHEAEQQAKEVFVYKPQVPELATPHYFIADIDNGTILASTDLSEPAPIASLAKLMTAVVAAEELDLDGRVKILSPTFVASLIPRLSDRSSVSMYSLLQLLLVESSNEAAETIAGEMGREAFIEAMNAKARQLGMLQTHFADPSGLSAENTSTLGDLYTLTKYIQEERRFIFEITANAEVPSAYQGGEFDGLINFNEVEDMDSFIGGKVGETLAAKQTSISLHQLEFQDEERTLIVILLGSEDRTGDIETLLTYVQDRFGR